MRAAPWYQTLPVVMLLCGVVVGVIVLPVTAPINLFLGTMFVVGVLRLLVGRGL